MGSSRSNTTVPGVIVFGMHRSGTSLLTRLLEASGFYVGEENELLPPQSDNEEGFWERRDVMELNEWLYEVTDARKPPWPVWTGWLHGRALTLEDLTEAQSVTFRTKAAGIREQLTKKNQPWVVKDPRICLTFPCWADVLGPTVAVMLHRNPVEIAASLKKRHDFPAEFSLALWESHLRYGLNATLGIPRILLSLDELNSDPARTMGRLFDFLNSQGIPLRRSAEELSYSSIIKPGLLHHKASRTDEFRSCTKDQQDLIRILLEKNLPEEPLPIPESCKQALTAFHLRLDGQARQQKDLDRLSAEVRELKDSLSFQGQLIHQYRSLSDGFQETLEEDRAPRSPSCFKRVLHRLTDSRPFRSAEMIGKIENLQKRDTGLQLSLVAPPPSPPHLAVVLRVEDRRWLPASLKACGHLGCRTLVVSFPHPDMAAAVEEDVRRAPLPRSMTVLFCECAAYQSPRLPPSVVERLAPHQPDWILAHPANVFLSPPPRYDHMLDWLDDMGKIGIQRVGFHEYNFLPCREAPEHFPESFQDTIPWHFHLGPIPKSGLAWRCVQPSLLPAVDKIPEELRRAGAAISPGILRRYLFLNPLHAREIHGRPPALPSCADLAFDDGHPERLNPYIPAKNHPPLFEESNGPE